MVTSVFCHFQATMLFVKQPRKNERLGWPVRDPNQDYWTECDYRPILQVKPPRSSRERGGEIILKRYEALHLFVSFIISLPIFLCIPSFPLYSFLPLLTCRQSKGVSDLNCWRRKKRSLTKIARVGNRRRPSNHYIVPVHSRHQKGSDDRLSKSADSTEEVGRRPFRNSHSYSLPRATLMVVITITKVKNTITSRPSRLARICDSWQFQPASVSTSLFRWGENTESFLIVSTIARMNYVWALEVAIVAIGDEERLLVSHH